MSPFHLRNITLPTICFASVKMCNYYAFQPMSPSSKDQYLACNGISFADIDFKLVADDEALLRLPLCTQLSIYHKASWLINRKIHGLSAQNQLAYNSLTKWAMTI